MSNSLLSRSGMSNEPTVITKNKTPIWSIIVIIILVVLLIGIPILIWFYARSRPSKGAGTSCTDSGDCATGLSCVSGTCQIPACTKPSIPTNLDDDQTLNGFLWDVEITWDVVTDADNYIIYVGDTMGFDPQTESVYVGISEVESFVIEGIPPLTTGYVRVIGVSDDCGIGTQSSEYEFNTSAII